MLLQGDITAEDYDVQLLKWSTPYRTILGTISARRALEYGFTTIRDLETEGAGYADVDIKKAINNGVIPGPRMQVAGRSMNVTGAYPLLGYSWELKMPKGVQEVDGPEDGRKAVREQISHGVDWIKVYSDRSYFVRPDGVLDDVPTFTLEELKAIVDETHRERRKVASHASALNGVHNSVEAGVDTIEHGQYIADADLKTMVAHGTYYVPTLFVGEYVAEGRAATGAKVWLDMVKIHEETFSRALKAGVKIAFGTDAGGFDWKINPAKEFPLMVKAGMTPAQALHSANMTAAELLGMQDKIGSLEAGKYRRHRGRAGRSHDRHPPTGEGELRDEGRRGVREAVRAASHDGIWGAAVRGISPVTAGRQRSRWRACRARTRTSCRTPAPPDGQTCRCAARRVAACAPMPAGGSAAAARARRLCR